MASLTVYEYLEDFDDSELSEYENQERLEEAVLEYNEEYGTSYKPTITYRNYLKWKKEKTEH